MRNYEYVHDFVGGSGERERERVAEWQGRYYTHKLQIVESAIFSPGSRSLSQSAEWSS
jgi:hypothetical protein